jgi:transposase
MEKGTIKTKEEWIRIYIKGKITRKEGGERIGISVRQFQRLVKRYQKEGINGLYHRLEGKASNHKYQEEFKEKVLELLRNKYWDFGATLASEHLMEEENINVNKETLRLWMRKEKLLVKHRKRKPYRRYRERKPRFGEMLQIDGSFHNWFGVDKPKACLLNLIDDATSVNICLFDKEETVRGACTLLWKWIKQYGIPLSIYADRRNTYISEDFIQANGLFGQMCKSLSIKTIPAFSPQAKGRIERSNQTHQDRLIKKMRLKNIQTIEQANNFLPSYLSKHNKLFSIAPNNSDNAHRPLKPNTKLDDICFIEIPRKVACDWTVKYKGITYQIIRKYYCPAKSTVYIRESFSGTIYILFKNQSLSYTIISNPSFLF